MNEVLEVQKKILGMSTLLDLSSNANRRFIMEGSMQRLPQHADKKSKKYRLFLFTDIIMYCEVKSRMGPTQYKYVAHKSLHSSMLIDYNSSKGGNCIFEVYHTDDKQKFKFQAPSSYEKNAWKKAIEIQIQSCVEQMTSEVTTDGNPFPGAAPIIEPLPALPPRIGMMRTLSTISHSRKSSGSFNVPTSTSMNYGNSSSSSAPSSPLSYSFSTPTSSPLTSPSSNSSSVSSSLSPSSANLGNDLLPSGLMRLSNRVRSMSTGSDSGDGSSVISSSSSSAYPSPFGSPSASPSTTSSSYLSKESPSSGSIDDSSGSDEQDQQSDGKVDMSTFLSPLEALHHVLYSEQTDVALLQTFVLSYHQFISGSDLITMVSRVYTGTGNVPSLSQSITYSRYHTKKRLLEFVRTWVWHLYYRDFKGKRLFSDLLDFLAAASKDGFRDDANAIKLLILKMAGAWAGRKSRKVLPSENVFSPGGGGFLGSPLLGLPSTTSTTIAPTTASPNGSTTAAHSASTQLSVSSSLSMSSSSNPSNSSISVSPSNSSLGSSPPSPSMMSSASSSRSTPAQSPSSSFSIALASSSSMLPLPVILSPSPSAGSIPSLSLSNSPAAATAGPVELKLADTTVQGLAEQLSLIDHAMFKRVSVSELAGMAWKEKTSGVSGVVAMIERFNVVSQWVSTEIVCARDAKSRSLIAEKFIATGFKLMESRNFNGLMAVLSGLNRSPVARLKQTWAMVSPSSMVTFEKLNELMDPKHNFKSYRESLRKTLPAVPYFGIYTRDVTFIEEANETTINGLVNVAKFQMLSKIFKEIQCFQGVSYAFPDDEAYRAFLKRLYFMPEEILYTFSKKAEGTELAESPRKGTTVG